MMGERQVQQNALFYEFSLERHEPERHLLRSIDRFVELDGLRQELAPFYSDMGRPSIDPELLIRMLIVGYCLGIRSERRLCEEVHLNRQADPSPRADPGNLRGGALIQRRYNRRRPSAITSKPDLFNGIGHQE